jgi:hypothetical protein
MDGNLSKMDPAGGRKNKGKNEREKWEKRRGKAFSPC